LTDIHFKNVKKTSELQTKLPRANPGLVSRPDPQHDRQSGRGLERSTGLIGEENMARTRAADDFKAIRARMEKLRRERERANDAETNARSVRLWLCRANGDPITISIGRPRNGLTEYWVSGTERHVLLRAGAQGSS
jgi:hypothetical protein